MDTDTQRTQLTSFTATVSGAGATWVAELVDRSGALAGTADGAGRILDSSGQLVCEAPVEQPGRADRATGILVRVSAPGGEPLGEGSVVKYGIGPRSSYANLAITSPTGAELARLERSGRDSSKLVATAGDRQLATVEISRVKAGFLRRNHVLDVRIDEALEEPLRTLLAAVIIRYQAVLLRVQAAASRD